MPWKLIFYLIIVGLILVFIGLNLGNTTDISLGFHEFTEVPVFMGLFVAFFLGVAVTIPVAVQSSSRKTRAKSDRKLQREERKRMKKEARQTKKAEKSGEKSLTSPENKGAFPE
jgi:cytochrome b subunit of formate dehydrogenase